MTERHRSPDPTLEVMLEDLRAHLDLPRVVDLAASVHLRLVSQDPAPRRIARRSPRVRHLRLVFAVGLALVLVASGLLVFSPATRHAVGDWLGLRGVRVEQPSPPPDTVLGSRFALGKPVGLAEAERRAGFQVLRPAASQYGNPDEIYLADTPAGGAITLLYRSRPGLPAAVPGENIGLLLTEFRAQIDDVVLRKELAAQTQLEQVSVDGQPGYWFQGQHELTFADRDGRFFQDRSRLAGNTLIWERGPLTIRLESGLSRADVLRIANALRTS